MVSYEGIFLDEESIELVHSLEKDKLALVNDEIYCTFKYHPSSDEIFDDIVGSYIELYLIGYGNDGQNSGFEVSISDGLRKYYVNFDEEKKTLKVPLITASLNYGA